MEGQILKHMDEKSIICSVCQAAFKKKTQTVYFLYSMWVVGVALVGNGGGGVDSCDFVPSLKTRRGCTTFQ